MRRAFWNWLSCYAHRRLTAIVQKTIAERSQKLPPFVIQERERMRQAILDSAGKKRKANHVITG